MYREVYTVTRLLGTNKRKRAQDDFLHVQDEAGEFLYGGTGISEQIEVKLEEQQADGSWLDVTP